MSESNFQLGDRIAAFIKSNREERNWTQDNLERSSGVSTGTISRIEQGLTDVTLQTTLKICDALDISYGTLYIEVMGSPKNASIYQSDINLLKKKINTPEKGVMTLSELLKNFDEFGANINKGKEHVSEKANQLLKKYQNKNNEGSFFTPDMLDLLIMPDPGLDWLRINTSEPRLSRDEVMKLLGEGGIITRSNVNDFLRSIGNKPFSIASRNQSSAELSKFFYRANSRPEGWSIKLENLLEIDNILAKDKKAAPGEITALWWEHEHYNLEFYRPCIVETERGGVRQKNTYRAARLALLDLQIERWLETTKKQKPLFLSRELKD